MQNEAKAIFSVLSLENTFSILTDQSLLPGSQEEQQSKKKGGVYNRDDLELQIMIGQEVHLGTLACTAVEPLKVFSIATYHYPFASNSTKSKKKNQNLKYFFGKS